MVDNFSNVLKEDSLKKEKYDDIMKDMMTEYEN